MSVLPTVLSEAFFFLVNAEGAVGYLLMGKTVIVILWHDGDPVSRL